MDRPGFIYLLTKDNQPLLQRSGLVLTPDGALKLAQLPAASAGAGSAQAEVKALSGPAGIGIGADGTLYIADPFHHRVTLQGACGVEGIPLACLGGFGSLPGQLNTPRGVLVGPRGRLYIADSGNHRVQVVDLDSLQIVGVWGQADSYALPVPSDNVGKFNEPWDLAADASGCIYVVDYGNRRIQKFDTEGKVMPGFWENLTVQSGVSLIEPAFIATALVGGEERLLVIDLGDNQIKVFKTDGSWDENTTQAWASAALNNPAGLSFTGGRLYVGDSVSMSVYVFDQSGSLLGTLPAPLGGLYGLAVDAQGRLLIHSGSTVGELLPGQVYATQGTFIMGPLDVGAGDTGWHRLEVRGMPIPEGSHVRLFTLTSDQPLVPPVLPAAPPDQPEMDETAWNIWRSAPRDVLDIQILNQPGRYLWVAGLLVSDGNGTPLLQQMRVEYDHPSWLRFLPGLYALKSPTPESPDFIAWMLAFMQSRMEDEARLIDELPILFDPAAAPATGAPDAWLDWLAGWLALSLAENWPEEKKRAALEKIFGLYRRRGTVEGLLEFIELYTGAKGRIIEPAQTASLWMLGQNSRLGFTTMLVPAEAQGAVLGTTAELDASHLTGAESYGAPLFEDLADEFVVQVYGAQVKSPQSLALLRQIIEQEKPAHTRVCLQVIEAKMRVGGQASLGVDAIVGTSAPEMVMGDAVQLGVNSGLGESSSSARRGEGQGNESRLGINSKLA